MDRGATVHGPGKMWLVVFRQGQPDRFVEGGGTSFLIGRGEDCQLVLDDPRVSRHHASIDPGPGTGRLVHDLDSANGTLVNGRKVSVGLGFMSPADKIAELNGDDWLQVGDTVMCATTQDPAPAFASKTFDGPIPPARPDEE